MGKEDKRIDAYLAKSADFAKPILRHLRELMHEGCPDLEESIKWGFPHFGYHGIMAGMASFKNHCSFGFWKAALLTDPDHRLNSGEDSSAGSFGRITKLSDLPPDRVLLRMIREAARLNEEGIKIVRKPPARKKPLVIPAQVTKALARNKAARKTFDSFSYSQQKDYVEWITEARTEPTREKRIVTMLEWLAEGKTRHWKYQRA